MKNKPRISTIFFLAMFFTVFDNSSSAYSQECNIAECNDDPAASSDGDNDDYADDAAIIGAGLAVIGAIADLASQEDEGETSDEYGAYEPQPAPIYVAPREPSAAEPSLQEIDTAIKDAVGISIRDSAQLIDYARDFTQFAGFGERAAAARILNRLTDTDDGSMLGHTIKETFAKEAGSSAEAREISEVAADIIATAPSFFGVATRISTLSGRIRRFLKSPLAEFEDMASDINTRDGL